MTIIYNAQKWNKQQQSIGKLVQKITYKNILHFEVLGGRSRMF